MPKYFQIKLADQGSSNPITYRLTGLSHNPARLINKKLRWEPDQFGSDVDIIMEFGLVKEHKQLTVRVDPSGRTGSISDVLQTGKSIATIVIELIQHEFVNTPHGTLPAHHHAVLTLTLRDVSVKLVIPSGGYSVVNMNISGSIEARQNA